MSAYRFRWIDGDRRMDAEDADEAVRIWREKWPRCASLVSLANLQIRLGARWKFASEVPTMLGGNRK